MFLYQFICDSCEDVFDAVANKENIRGKCPQCGKMSRKQNWASKGQTEISIFRPYVHRFLDGNVLISSNDQYRHELEKRGLYCTEDEKMDPRGSQGHDGKLEKEKRFKEGIDKSFKKARKQVDARNKICVRA